MQAISIGGVDCATKVGSICTRFVDMGDPFKYQVENGISKLFDFRGQNIDVPGQAVFILKDSVIHGEEGKKSM